MMWSGKIPDGRNLFCSRMSNQLVTACSIERDGIGGYIMLTRRYIATASLVIFGTIALFSTEAVAIEPTLTPSVWEVAVRSLRGQRFEEAYSAFLTHAKVKNVNEGLDRLASNEPFCPIVDDLESIAVCLIGMGRKQEALVLLNGLEKYQPKIQEDTDVYDLHYRVNLRKGLIYESLKDYLSAVACYVRTILEGYQGHETSVRLVDLYDSSGQLKDLEGLLDEVDVINAKEMKADLSQLRQENHLPTQITRQFIRILEMEDRQEWALLVNELLKGECRDFELYDPYSRRNRTYQIEIAEALARHPEVAVPLLLDDQLKWRGREGFAYLCLGLCGTPSALQILEQKARSATSFGEGLNLCYCISLAGETGNDLLKRLTDPPQSKAMAEALNSVDWREGFYRTPYHLELPPVPTGVRMPKGPLATLKDGEISQPSGKD